ncbi:hypothetical protein Dimus_033336 [Dionaea muscipula]
MAKEIIGDQVSHEITTRGKDNLSIKSTGRPSSRTKGDGSGGGGPHYLRASTGSCHDVCKYGKPHTFEAKPWHAMRKQFLVQSKGDQTPVEILVCPGRRAKGVVQANIHESSAVPEVPLPMKSSEYDVPSPEEAIHRKLLSSNALESSIDETPLPVKSSYKMADSTIQEAALHEKCPSLNTSVSILGATLLPIDGPPIPNDASKAARPGVTESVELAITLPADRKSNSKPVPSNVDGFNSAAPLKPKHVRNMRVAPLLTRTKGMESETKMLNNSRASRLAVEKILASCPTSLSTEAKTSFKVAGEKAAIPATSSLRQKTSGTELTSLVARKNVNQNQNAKVTHRRQQKRIQKAETTAGEGKGPPNLLLQHCSGSSLSHKVDDPYDESGYADNEVDGRFSKSTDSGEVNSRRHRNIGELHSEAETCAAVKLKFRRGKVVQHQFEDSTLRRQRFRRGRILDEGKCLIGDLQHKSFKRRVAESITYGTKPVEEKVVLRHQDVQEKKEGQVLLLNNVIEETASKLVETRKSKVQALVGAFETVISLQDRKQSADKPSESIS